jgi:hypothetical protein
MLYSCDKSWYNKLSYDLEKDYTKGINLHPNTVTEACNIIVIY